MTNDELKLTFKKLSAATEGIVREAFRQRAEWKKKTATETQTISAASDACQTDVCVGRGKARGE